MLLQDDDSKRDADMTTSAATSDTPLHCADMPTTSDASCDCADTACETIRFPESREIVQTHIRYLQASVYRMLFAVLIFAQLGWVVPLYTDGRTDVWMPIVVSVTVVLIGVMFHFSQQKQIEEGCRNIGESEYCIYDDYLEYRAWDRGGTLHTFYRIAREEAKMPVMLPTLLVFRGKGVSFCVPREYIGADSRLLKILYPNGMPQAPKRVRVGKASVGVPHTFTPYVRAMMSVCAVAAIAMMAVSVRFPHLYWLPLVLLVIPLALTVLVILAAVRGEGVRVLALVVAVLCGFVLLSSSFIALFADMEDDFVDVDPYFERLEIQTPVFGESYTTTKSVYDEETRNFVELKGISLYDINQESRQMLHASVQTDTRWIALPREGALYEEFVETFDLYGDVCIIYNLTEDTYNTVSGKDGVCDYMIIIFEATYGGIQIITFSK